MERQIDWETCIPLENEARARYTVRLSPETVEELDAFRHDNRWNLPWITSTRSNFIETAVRFLLKVVKSRPHGVI